MSEKRKTRRKLPRWKKLLFSLVTLLLVLAVIESVSFFAIRGMLDTNMDQLQADCRISAMTGIGRQQSGKVAHPYLGSVHDPHAHGVEFDGRTMPINELGFADDKPAVQKRGPSTLEDRRGPALALGGDLAVVVGRTTKVAHLVGDTGKS